MSPGEELVALNMGLVRLGVSCEGVSTVALFTLRVGAAAASIFTVFALIMGWREIMDGLERLRMPSGFITLLSLSMVNIPLFLREASKMLSARKHG